MTKFFWVWGPKRENDMTNEITLTDEQMAALKAGQSITIEPPKQRGKFVPTKHRVRDEAHSRAIQEFVFEHGGEGWAVGGNRVQYTDKPYLFVDKSGQVRFLREEGDFLNDLNQEADMPILADSEPLTPCQRYGLREGQWVWARTPQINEWVRLQKDDRTIDPFFDSETWGKICLHLNEQVDWSQGIHDEQPVEKWEPPMRFLSKKDGRKVHQYKRLLLWRDEHCPDYAEPELGEEASYVFWFGGLEGWDVINTTDADLLSVPMPYSAAKQLAHDLNTGKVEL